MIEMGPELIIEFMSELGRRHYKALSRIGANFFDLRLVKNDHFLLILKAPKYPIKIGTFYTNISLFNLKVKIIIKKNVFSRLPENTGQTGWYAFLKIFNASSTRFGNFSKKTKPQKILVYRGGTHF